MKAIYKRELRSYFNSMTGWVFAAALSVFIGIYFTAYNLMAGYTYFSYALNATLIVFMALVPVLTMRSLAEERRSKTDQLLFTAPVSLTGVVLGKYFAMLTVLAAPVALACVCPLIIRMNGTAHFKADYASLLAYFLLAAAEIALGLLVSSLTESPAIAAILTLTVNAALFLMSFFTTAIPQTELASLIGFAVIIVLVAFLAYYMTKSVIAAYAVGAVGIVAEIILYFVKKDLFAGAINKVIDAMSVFSRVDLGTSGILDLSGIVYFVTAAALFVFLSVQAVEKRRWS